ncbi:hypothetical protein Peur_052819 [Populus x canadensis]
MENKERAHLESHYQTELESVKNEVARLTDLLEQLLRAKNGEGTSTQPPEGAPAAHIIRQIAPIPTLPLQPPFPIWYKPELTCEYHAGIPGHGLETCYAFKKKLLELIKIGWVSFEDTPNINSKPLPSHDASNSG